ncbi:MAG: zf-HC2 domain-containing protein [Candidatus Sulfotelmatobacter sp.]|jgi:anti-sigma factor RsiW
MVCDPWKEKLDTYLDAELPDEEMRAFDAHVRSCASCSADALGRLQMKRTIQVAGKHFTPAFDFRQRVQQSIASQPQRGFHMEWMFAAAAAVIVVAAILGSTYWQARSARNRVLSEIADLHVATLASSSPVDVISTDRHTVKPWFQGRIPFSFNLPDLQNSGFTLVGGRMAYLDQSPGAELIYDVGKHHISVFIFQNHALKLPAGFGESFLPKNLPFNMETWSEVNRRYFVVGDASPADIDNLARLFKAAS